MDALGHEAVDLTGALVGEKGELAVHDFDIIANHGACLGILGQHFRHFSGRFIDEWEEKLPVDLLLLEDAFGETIAMVREVTGQDSGEVEFLPLLGVGQNHFF